MRNAASCLACVCLLAFVAPLCAADRYAAVELGKLPLIAGQIPATTDSPRNHAVAQAMRPVVRIEGGEGYVFPPGAGNLRFDGTRWNIGWGALNLHALRLAVRAPEGAGDITGRLLFPNKDWSGMVAVEFKIPAAQANAEAKKDFLQAKRAYLEELLDRQVAGAAYFRYQLRTLNAEAGLTAAEEERLGFRRGNFNRPDTLADTYALFTGGRAVAENLQLDRAFPRAVKPAEATIPIAEIKGITVQAFDWAPIIKDLHPATDPLAALIPDDQHAVFFRSFTAFTDLLDQADQQSLPLLQLAEERSEDALTKDRYQRQLGLSMTALGKILGPQLISSVAITGSDPYLRLGSDLAILFEASAQDPSALHQLIIAQITAHTASTPDLRVSKIDGPTYSAVGYRTADRTVSSYVAVLGNTVVVTNSPAQLDVLGAVAKKQRPAIAATPEYTFFRNRYSRAHPEETALLVLTDATIRRWCGPQVRIADARRTAALAVLADFTAERMARPEIKPDTPVENLYPAVDLGELTRTPTGVRSSRYNTLAFLTPLAEVPLTAVTADEKAAYENWRDTYQRGYRQFFDPIAVQFSLQRQRLALDVTVMPLIDQTDYNRMFSLRFAKGAAPLQPAAGDPHGALAHLVFALNPKADEFKQAGGFLRSIVGEQVNPLGWLGDSIALYADADPFWADLAKSADLEKFFEKEFPRLPVGLRIASSSPLQLAAFITALRAYADQSAPNTVTWETRTHAGFSYVRIAPTAETARTNEVMKQLAIYYVTTPDALVLSLSEPVIKRSLERYAASTQPAAATAPATQPWLGQSTALRIDRTIVAALVQAGQKDLLARNQVLAWSNLPILNELRRLYPKEDAPALYTRLWQIRLHDPAGEAYLWNAAANTYESPTFGHPAAPKAPATPPAYLRDFQSADFGLTLEENGLRARAILNRTAP